MRTADEVFGRTDLEGIKADDAIAPLGNQGYLGTPSGLIKKFDPKTEKTTTLPPPKENNGDACPCSKSSKKRRSSVIVGLA